jgi:histone deacetylase 6
MAEAVVTNSDEKIIEKTLEQTDQNVSEQKEQNTQSQSKSETQHEKASEEKSSEKNSEVDEISEKIQSLSIDVPVKKVGIYYDKCMLLHREAGHPEKPERLEAIMAKLISTGTYKKCIPFEGRPATKEEILLIHTDSLYTEVLDSKSIQVDVIHFSGDTFGNKYSSDAAHVAAGCVIDLAERVVKNEIDNGFAFIRPPGHHAEKDDIMGFCLFNNVAIAAKYAQVKLGLKKVLILDWDVHHGNGTQHIFQDDPTVLYMSVHKGGHFYPGTGKVHEVGIGPGEGKTVNVPFLASGMGDADYYTCFKYVFVPIAKEFQPDLIIISAGFDCVKGDKLGPMSVTKVGFENMLSMLLQVNSKVVCALEGGYSLEPTAEAALSCVNILLGANPAIIENLIPTKRGFLDIQAAITTQQKYWNSLHKLGSEWEALEKHMENVEVEQETEAKCHLQ